MKCVCITFAWGSYRQWKVLYENCLASFKKWHPDIEMRVIGDEEMAGWKAPEDFEEFRSAMSMLRMQWCRKMFDEGYTKVILIGLDTFALSRWDELLDDETTPVLATLGGPFVIDPDIEHKFVFNPQHNWYENMTIGADLTCFNKKEALDDIIEILKITKRHDNYAIDFYVNQGNPSACKVVDWPYVVSPFVYNCRSCWPGLLSIDRCTQEDGSITWGIGGQVSGKFSPTTRYLPIEDKLYNHIGKHIKALCFDKSYNPKNISTYLNTETIQWLKEYSDVDVLL